MAGPEPALSGLAAGRAAADTAAKKHEKARRRQLFVPFRAFLWPSSARTVAERADGRETSFGTTACFHCGEPCPEGSFSKGGEVFCCRGCLVVHDLLAESGLGHFYELSRSPGLRVRQATQREQWAYLDEPALQQRLLDFTDGKVSRVTFHIPAIHCLACVWLLENLFRLHPGLGQSQVNFPRREVALSFTPEKIALSELVALLASLGYEPSLTLGELERPGQDPARKRQWLQLGIAGFAFGNIMLFSLPAYFGLDSLSGPLFKAVFGYLSLALAAPVLFYSAADYWRSALLSARQRVLTLDVPIALGLAALYVQSAFDIVSGRGLGFLDSMAGLVFFLLCGRAFQQKTYDRMAFDRDYKCFFPLSTRRRSAAGEECISISQLQVGDRLSLRHGELIPADARLVSGPAWVDYSFVTGESEPVSKQAGDYLYAGGKQVGGAIELETVKPVSQSYLTSLWDHGAFQKERDDNPNTLTDQFSRYFTSVVIAIALAAALFWVLSGNGARGLRAFVSVLIVACPCALALAAPFTLGTAQRLLARLQVFLKNALVLERLARVNAIVFDKTGTLTAAQAKEVSFMAGRDHEEVRSPKSEVRRKSEIRNPKLERALQGSEVRAEVEAQFPSPRPSPQGRGSSCRQSLESSEPTNSSTDWRRFSFSLGERAGVRGIQSENVPAAQVVKSAAEAIASRWEGSPETWSAFPLSREEAGWVGALARQSAHPHAARVGEWLEVCATGAVQSFEEVPGCGIAGTVQGHRLRLGSRAWLERSGAAVPSLALPGGSVSCLAIDGEFRGAFVLANALRPETGQLLAELGRHYELALLSGDNEKERDRFRALFGANARLRFNQSPLDKLGFIRSLQAGGKRVMMVGDGLNDAGALQQSDVGVAVVENIGAFSPASDVILAAGQVPRLFKILMLARKSVRIVRISFGISIAYNLLGISIAAAGILSPLISAALMPLSSISVVLFGCGATNWMAGRIGLTR